jgi:acyl-CoA hydrolase
VTLTAQVVYKGKTRMQIYIIILSGAPTQNRMVETGHCIMFFVLCDPAGYPVKVPIWVPQTKQKHLLENFFLRKKVG